MGAVVLEKRIPTRASDAVNGSILSRLPESHRLAAEHVWRCFSNVQGFAALFITGSVARGLESPDDLDFIAVWDRPISDQQRRLLVERCRGNRTVDPDTDRFHLNGVVPEFHFMAGKEQVQRLISDFCWRGEIPPETDADRMEGLLASLMDALPVFDPEALAHQWQKMLTSDYPPEYQLRRVHEQYTAACRRLAHLHRCQRWNDVFYLARIRLEFCEHIVKALVSLNRRFYWGGKWFEQQIERLPLKPEHTWARVCTILTAPDVTAAEEEMKRLAFSVGKIVKASLPEIDVDFSLKIIRHLKKDTHREVSDSGSETKL